MDLYTLGANLVGEASADTRVPERAAAKLRRHYTLKSIDPKTKKSAPILSPNEAAVYEKVVLRDLPIAIRLVIDTYRGRWKELERSILNHGHKHIGDYVSLVLGGQRWPEAERLILSNPTYAWPAAEYADAINEEWPKAEPIILTNFDAIMYYVIHVKGCWPEAELEIKNNPKFTEANMEEYYDYCPGDDGGYDSFNTDYNDPFGDDPW